MERSAAQRYMDDHWRGDMRLDGKLHMAIELLEELRELRFKPTTMDGTVRDCLAVLREERRRIVASWD